MADPVYNLGLNLQLPLLPSTSTPPETQKDLFDTFNAIRRLAQFLQDGKASVAPIDGEIYGMQNGEWVTIPGGLPDAPSDGKTYGRKDGGWVEVTGGGGGGGALEFLQEVTLASAGASFTFSGLDLDVDEFYQIEFICTGMAAGDYSANMFYNGDTTAANYNRQFLFSDGSGNSAGRVADASIMGGGAQSVASRALPTVANIKIYKKAGQRPIALAFSNTQTSGGIGIILRSHTRLNVANVTSITLASMASTFNPGTTARLYRLNK